MSGDLAANEADGHGVVWTARHRRARSRAHERELAVPLDALGVGAVERQPGEELGGHAPTLARVVRAARSARACGLRFPQREEQVRAAPDVREAAFVAH